jgi:MoaA/NifB/PqqE/SkfB family radical SAM enzyme
LKCLHCYSSSSPEAVEELSCDLLREAVSDAFAEGYNVVGISGGEPLMFNSLSEILRHAKSLGMITSVTTNGMLLDQKRIENLKGSVDLIAISLDGVAESHNRMRAHPRAFEMMQRRLAELRAAKIPFGFIFTLTLYNLHELEDVARFAVDEGAGLLQIHPLEEVGRAQEKLSNKSPDRLELTYAFLEAARIQELYEGKLQVQYDAVDREVVTECPARIFAAESNQFNHPSDRPLADLVSPLIIENDGSVVPIQYGFSQAYKIGNLKNGSLREQSARWKMDVYPSFLELCRKVFNKIADADKSEHPFTNWYGEITQYSNR